MTPKKYKPTSHLPFQNEKVARVAMRNEGEFAPSRIHPQRDQRAGTIALPLHSAKASSQKKKTTKTTKKKLAAVK